MITFADNFLAGSLITLLIPGSVLVSVAVWYTRTAIRRERDRRTEEAAEAAAVRPGAEPGSPQTAR